MNGPSYDARAVEAKWQRRWEAEAAWRCETRPTAPTYFVLVFPPYPNGKIHIGHVRNYALGDAVARYKRLRGRAVLHPIGFDAFGLPNEIEASRQGIEPEPLTRGNIAIMARQLRRLGFSYDWSKAIVTIDPQYYRWNQWLFLTLLERGLAYRKAARVQWCPGCRTSLANEQVRDRRCWRCDTAVGSRYQPQWFFRLRAYADEIWSETLRGVYPDNVAAMIRDWIGKTDGAELRYPVLGSGKPLSVFTTKPELSHGATYLALSPEHPRAAALSANDGIRAEAERLTRLVHESADPARLTDGVDTGSRAVHPLTGRTLPIWLAAYVDPELATGAVMGNPCHDRSDHAFGRAHGLPGRSVVSPDGSVWNHAERGPFLGDGQLHASGDFSGRRASEARADVVARWERKGRGGRSTVFAIRDWLVSRQRAWGTPIPVVHCPACGTVPLTRADLPVRLPTPLRDTGRGNPLAHAPGFSSCRCPTCEGGARRETDTMDTFIDTAWYYLRCTNPEYRDSLCDPAAIRRWGPADLYVGGIEIAVPIMLYGSFITKGLRDAGHLGFGVPCRSLLAHDMVLKDGRKMSKSLGNTVDPEEIVDRVGADPLRLLILSLAPPLKKIEWSEKRLLGCCRFLNRVWRLGDRHAARGRPREMPPAAGEERLQQRTDDVARAVARDMERLRPNTCITTLIKFLYELEAAEGERGEGDGSLAERPAFDAALRALLVLLSPFTPHLCEELWELLGNSTGLHLALWPDRPTETATCDAAWKGGGNDAGRNELVAAHTVPHP